MTALVAQPLAVGGRRSFFHFGNFCGTRSRRIAKEILAPLLDPEKIATLKGKRPANARFYRTLGWIETARLAGGDLSAVFKLAQSTAGYGGTNAAQADRNALCEAWRILLGYGCLDSEDIAGLKRGNAPVITIGGHASETIHLDHLLPRSLVPELNARFHNLRPVPSQTNLAKGMSVTKKELNLARRWHKGGLLSGEGLSVVEQVYLHRLDKRAKAQASIL